MTEHIRSVDTSGSNTLTTPSGARAHRDHIAHNEVLAKQFYSVRPGVWNFVGNGLSNQTFVEGPGGIIAIDTGESIEEMRSALAALRQHTSAPIAAVVYSHFHYIEGTKAVLEEGNHVSPLPIYGHPKIAGNRERTASEISPAYVRGMVEQFGIFLPADGPDGLVNIGLGFYFRSPDHAPFTPGHLPVTHEFTDGATLTIAGLDVHVYYAPSDSDDSVTMWFPTLDLVVHNLIWPALFNVFAIRGEEYRDCQVMIRGIDQLRALQPHYLVATHGPPLIGQERVAAATERYRDSLQFLWDQTVRGINKGFSTDQLAETVRLPDLYDVDYLTSERYGIAEHHVRQIHNGLRGFFDGDESKLLPVAPAERYGRLIKGFGGRDAVTRQVDSALQADDVRWATELATWLVRSEGATDPDRQLLARCLRVIAERTPAANIRNWCLARARHLDGTTPMNTMFRHRFTQRALDGLSTASAISTLRVLLDPSRVEGFECHVGFVVGDDRTGLHIRNGVAVPTSGEGADVVLTMSRATLDSLLSEKAQLSDAVADGSVHITGDEESARTALGAFELKGLRS